MKFQESLRKDLLENCIKFHGNGVYSIAGEKFEQVLEEPESELFSIRQGNGQLMHHLNYEVDSRIETFDFCESIETGRGATCHLYGTQDMHHKLLVIIMKNVVHFFINK